MGGLLNANCNNFKPEVAMVGLQCIIAGLTLLTRAALLHGMSPRVFVVYRQAMGAFIMAPIVYFNRRRNPHDGTSLGLKTYSLIFVITFIGVTANQNAYFEGLYLSSSTIATAMINLLPAVTFALAAIAGLEKVNVRSLSSIAKIMGTVLCVGGAICMGLVKGPKLLNTEKILMPPSKSVLMIMFGNITGAHEKIKLGCLILFFCCCFWSFWMIMQVPISASCPDHLYLTFLTCFFATIQSTIFTFLVENDLQVWHLGSNLELGSCLYAGVCTAVSFFIQTWCISQRGPLFVAMFMPLCTVITTAIASLGLHEKLYIGSLLGAFAVIVGLYVVLWGKAKDLKKIKQDTDIQKLPSDEASLKISTTCGIDLEEPFLLDKSITN